MTEKTERDVEIGEPDEAGIRQLTAVVGALVPLRPEEIEAYSCLRNMKDATKIEAVILYDAQKNPVMTPLVVVYPEKGKCHLVDTTMNVPIAYGEDIARIAIAYLRLQKETVVKAAKEYVKRQQALENSLESLRKALK